MCVSARARAPDIARPVEQLCVCVCVCVWTEQYPTLNFIHQAACVCARVCEGFAEVSDRHSTCVCLFLPSPKLFSEDRDAIIIRRIRIMSDMC